MQSENWMWMIDFSNFQCQICGRYKGAFSVSYEHRPSVVSQQVTACVGVYVITDAVR